VGYRYGVLVVPLPLGMIREEEKNVVKEERFDFCNFSCSSDRAVQVLVTEVLISPQPDLLPDVFCLMVRIFRLMIVLLYT